jgi:hypothetical protein
VSDNVLYEVSLCSEYENLLNECQRALDRWNERSEQLREGHQAGEATGRELLLLQARFAKAYTVLRRHVERCENCQLVAWLNADVSRIEGAFPAVAN